MTPDQYLSTRVDEQIAWLSRTARATAPLPTAPPGGDVPREELQREKMLDLTGAPPYDTGQTFPAFVARIEALLGSENTVWAAQMLQPGTAPPTDGNG